MLIKPSWWFVGVEGFGGVEFGGKSFDIMGKTGFSAFLSLGPLFSAKFWSQRALLDYKVGWGPCTLHISSMFAYFSALASILEKFAGALFSRENRKEHFCSPPFMAVMVTA